MSEHLRCDMCSLPDPNPAWDYVCDSFEGLVFATTDDGPEETVAASASFHSDEGWLLCDACHVLVEAGDKEAVVNRVLDSPYHERPIDAGHREKFAEMIRQFHATFWDTKKGPPTQICKP